MKPETRQRLDEAFTRPASESFRQLRELSTRTGSDHIEYLFNSPSALACKIERSRYVGEQVRSQNGRVLDFGSGCGFLAGALAAEGAAEVVGIECNDPRRHAAEYLVQRVFQATNVEFKTTIDDLPPASFDAVILANVISHVRDVPAVLMGLRNLLKWSGLIFVEDNNNLQSVLVRHGLRTRVWPGERLAGEIVYRNQRAEHIRSTCPEIPGDEVDALADATYGLTFSEIDAFVNHRLAQGPDPFPTAALRWRAPVEPDTGQYHENAFRPSEVETLLFNLGFVPVRTGAKHVFDYKRAPLASWVFKTFPRLSLNVSPAFEVLAAKK